LYDVDVDGMIVRCTVQSAAHTTIGYWHDKVVCLSVCQIIFTSTDNLCL